MILCDIFIKSWFIYILYSFWSMTSPYMQKKTARLTGRLSRLISQEEPRTFWGGAPPQEVLGPSSEGPRPLLGYWNLLIYLPICQFFECMVALTLKLKIYTPVSVYRRVDGLRSMISSNSKATAGVVKKFLPSMVTNITGWVRKLARNFQ